MTWDELVQYLRLGGVTMAMIAVSSVVALGVAIERVIALWGVSGKARELGEAVARQLLRGDVAAARGVAQRSQAIAADMFLAGFTRLEQARGREGTIEAAVERERAQVGLRLRRNLWLLGTIAAITPFVGLFGTVAGIMRSFRELGIDVQQGGTGGTAAVMAGISEALIATAAGILVAVQAMVFYNYFQARLGRVVVELRLLGDEFVELLREARTAPAPVQDAGGAAAAEAPPPPGRS